MAGKQAPKTTVVFCCCSCEGNKSAEENSCTQSTTSRATQSTTSSFDEAKLKILLHCQQMKLRLCCGGTTMSTPTPAKKTKRTQRQQAALKLPATRNDGVLSPCSVSLSAPSDATMKPRVVFSANHCFNHFELQHFGESKIDINIGESIVPYTPYPQFNTDKDRYLQIYHAHIKGIVAPNKK